MIALDSLVGTRRIVRVDVELGPKALPRRLLYATPDFVRWAGERLESDEPSPLGSDTRPIEQLDYLFYSYCSGLPLLRPQQFREIKSEQYAVWELKTLDFRIFGWFAKRDCFVAVFGDWTDHIKDHDLYRGYRLEVRRLRRELGVGDALCVKGVETEDVLSL